MNRPRTCLITALVAVSAIAAARTANASPPALSKTESRRPEAGAEPARLTATCGWHQRTVIQPISDDAMIATSS
jgi:hypothetical protein